MVHAIGSATAYGAAGSGAAAASLEAQLARYQKQLSDCVNCDSAKTAEGKVEIEALSRRIGDIRDKIDKLAEARPAAASTRSSDRPDPAGSSAAAGGSDDSVAVQAVTRPASGTLGGLVDVFA
jgi:hypothetical protein